MQKTNYKVKQLVERLLKLDPNQEVLLFNEEDEWIGEIKAVEIGLNGKIYITTEFMHEE